MISSVEENGVTLVEARTEGYAAGITGKPSYLAPIGLYEHEWLLAWIDGRVASRTARGTPGSWPAAADDEKNLAPVRRPDGGR